MKKLCFAICLAFLLSGCASHQGLNTGEFRAREYKTNIITLNDGGLTPQQVSAIASTKPPSAFPVDVSIIIVKDWQVDSNMETLFLQNIVAELEKSAEIKRVVPIPKFLMPERINFQVIQELGIRALTEYVLVFVLDGESAFRWTNIVQSKFEAASIVDCMIVDAQTTAIMASDRLHSRVEYTDNLFKTGEADRARNEVFEEQSKLLGEQIRKLFEPNVAEQNK
jgi:hypothetical protein